MPSSSTQNLEGGASQSRFRLNPKPSYSERMSETRAEIRRMIAEALRQAANDHTAKMKWSNYWRDVVEKYHVQVVGWPHHEVPFKNLSDVSNIQKLEVLHSGWKKNDIRFVRLSDTEFAALKAQREQGQRLPEDPVGGGIAEDDD